MGSQESSLFRDEVVRRRADRLHGTVNLATPIAWQVIGFLILASLLISLSFLAVAPYARVETVLGAVTLDKGVANIIPSRSGVVAALEVSEGQRVRTGQVLARIRSEEEMIGGNTAPARSRRILIEQDANLATQGGMLLNAANAEKARFRAQIAGLSAELKSLNGQIDDQLRLVELASADMESAQRFAIKGFISRRDLDARQTSVISRRQQLAQLEQSRSAKLTAIAEAHQSLAQSGANTRAQIAGSQSDRLALTQQLVEADLAQGYTITSPVDGIVTALTTRLGQSANNQQQLMLVVPANAELQAELYVPTSAAGFIRRGQHVRLAIDTFPYQRFGTVAARIADISAATIAKESSTGPTSVYLVTAKMEKPFIQALGHQARILPGMTVTARIVTDKRTLFEWLFRPLFAVRNR